MTDSISERCSKLYEILTGISQKKERFQFFTYESFLDSFFSLMDTSLTIENQRKDKHIDNFCRNFRSIIEEVRSLRVSRQDFELLKVIGRGHFGEVYIVKEKGTNDVYAMKILKKMDTLSNENVAFFREERDIMSLADSEWVVNLQYSFHDPEYLYLVMEYMPGGDLLTLLSRVGDELMNEEDTKFYLSQIIMAVHAVHVAGYIHRDVKPENILIDMTGHLKLADFGSATKLLNGKTVICKIPVGTPEYIAPEVLQSMNTGGGMYGAECDWWSVGIVCYEIIFGELPFSADSVIKLYGSIINFKENLVFPEDVEPSENAINLIKGLINDQNARLTFNQIAEHPFFNGLDWTTLKSTKPPHIPQLKDRFDTSNFDDIQTKSFNKVTEKPSLTNSLPFIGYTFTRNLSSRLEKNLKSPVGSHPQGDLAENSDKIKEIMSVNENLKNDINKLNITLTENEKKIKNLEKEILQNIDANKSLTYSVNVLTEQLNNEKNKNDELKSIVSNSNKSSKDVEELNIRLENMSLEIKNEKNLVSSLNIENEELKNNVVAFKNDVNLLTKKIEDSEQYWKEYENKQLKKLTELNNNKNEIQCLLDKTNEDFQIKQNQLNEEIKKYREIISNLEIKLNSYENNRESKKSESEDMSKKYNDLLDQFHLLTDDLKTKENDLKTAEITQLKLNQQVRNFENQENDLKLKVQNFEKRNLEIKLEIDNFMNVVDNLKQTNETLKKNLSEKESEKSELLLKLSSNSNQNDSMNRNHAEEVNNLNLQIDQLKNELNNKNNIVDDLNSKIKYFDERFTEKNEEILKLTNDLNKVESVVNTQKASNFKLSQELENFKFQINSIENDRQIQLADFNRINSSNKEQIFKLEATVAQYEKLLEFLGAGANKNKKSDSEPSPNYKASPKAGVKREPSIRNTRNLEQKLETERYVNLKLNNEVNDLKMQIEKLKNDLRKYEKSEKSERLSKSTFYSSNEIDVQSYNSAAEIKDSEKVEHALMNMCSQNTYICSVCLGFITFSKPITYCKNCSVISHSQCSDNILFLTCLNNHQNILSSIFVNDQNNLNHYFQINNLRNLLSKSNESNADNILISGTLSIIHDVTHNKINWIELKFILKKTSLIISPPDDGNNTDTSLANFDISEITKFRVFTTLQLSYLGVTSANNHSLIFGIYLPSSSARKFLERFFCGQKSSEEVDLSAGYMIALLAPNFEVKRQWIQNLQCTIASEPNAADEKDLYVCPPSTLASITSAILVTDNLLLIGHHQGVEAVLFPDKSIMPCFEEKTPCFQLILTGQNIFGVFSENHCLGRLKTKIKSRDSCPKMVKLNLICFPDHSNIISILHCDSNVIECAFIYYSTNELLVGVKYNYEKLTVIFRHRLENQPCVSVNVIDNILFIVQDKFYCFNEETKQKREVLDSKDSSLAFLIFRPELDVNYPMEIFKFVSNNVSGYLLCFSELGAFINKEGRFWTNVVLRWESSPLKFVMKDNMLLVFYSDCLHLRVFDDIDHVGDSPVIQIFHINFPRFMSFACENSVIVGNIKYDSNVRFYRLKMDSEKHRAFSSNTVCSIPSSSSFTKHGRRITSIFSKKKK